VGSHLRRHVLDFKLALRRVQGWTLLETAVAKEAVHHPEAQDVGGPRVPVYHHRVVYSIRRFHNDLETNKIVNCRKI